MKKFFILFILSFTMVLSVSLETRAADYMIGVRSGYFAWEPYLKDIGASGMSDIDWGTGVLYGPVFSVMFTEDLTLSLAALMGKQSTHWQSTFSDFSSNYKVTGNYYFETFRVDVDSALSYRLSSNFKVFVGYKYQYMEIEYSYTELRTDLTNVIDEVTVTNAKPQKSPFHGPAAGIGFSLPLTEYYFIAANLSALYMSGIANFDGGQYAASFSGGHVLKDDSGPNMKLKMRQIGMNFEPAIGVNPGNGLPIMTLGFRFQRSRVQYTGNNTEIPDKWLDDTLIGVFVTCVYMF